MVCHSKIPSVLILNRTIFKYLTDLLISSQVPEMEASEPKSLQQGCATTLVAALDPALTGRSLYGNFWLETALMFELQNFPVHISPIVS